MKLFSSKTLASLGLMFALLSPGLALAEDPPAPTATPEMAAPAMPDAAAMPDVAAMPEAMPTAAVEAAPAPVPNKGDTSWMMVSTLLVIMMSIPGLALFYGGLVRSKNMLSILMQVFTIFALITVLWAVYGYSLAFTPGNAFFGGFDRLDRKSVV